MNRRRSQKRLNFKTQPYKRWGEIVRLEIKHDFPHFGIKAGSIVILEIGCHYEEGTLGLWEADGKEYTTYAYAFNCFGDVGLTNNNGWSESYHPNEITFWGTVKAIETPFAVLQPEPKAAAAAETANEEITAICDNCQAKLTGRIDFIRGMGWKIKKDTTECVRCW